MIAVDLAPLDGALAAAIVVLAVPLLLAAAGELLSEITGTLNVGLEGMMLAGAFFAYLGADSTGSPLLGLVAGMSGGLLFSALMAILTVEADADQIVSGIGLNLAAVGLTGYLFDHLFSGRPQALVPILGKVEIPGLSSLPVIGEALFSQDLVTYGTFVLVPVLWLGLYRTTWGLSLRAVGEAPAAAETAGINPRLVRWGGIMAAGALGGIGGAFLVVVQVGIFQHQMTAGRGFLVLAAVIFGGWRPAGVVAACFGFAAADALQLRLVTAPVVPPGVWLAVAIVASGAALWRWVHRSRTSDAGGLVWVGSVAIVGVLLYLKAPAVAFPNQLWRGMPFVMALVVLASSRARARMPSHLGLEARRA